MYHAALFSKATNDNFLHLVQARQLLGGDWPVRDFFDNGLGLMYLLSALAERIVGYRLLSEALIVGTMVSASTYLVFRVVSRITGSTCAAVLAAGLIIVAAPRGYSYPKLIVYSVAATLWWGYVSKPTIARIGAFGAWAAVAFYWRPDHGLYVAIGLVLAALAAHGSRRAMVARVAVAGGTALALTTPFFLFVHLTVGVPAYARTGLTQARAEHTGHHTWPRLPGPAEVVRLESADEYAPTVSLRWTAESTAEERENLLARYGLTPLVSEGLLLQHVRLSERSVGRVRDLINEPIVDDTAGIDRSRAVVSGTAWPAWRRWSFHYPWLRIRVFPGISEHSRAAETVASLFYALPLIVLITAVSWLHRYLPNPVTGARVAAFAVFAIVVNLGLLRTPYEVRAVDGVVLPAILFGCCLAAGARGAAAAGGPLRWAATGLVVAFALLVMKSVAVAGELGDRSGWLAGEWRSVQRMRGAWGEVRGRLMASPPRLFYENRPAPIAVRLATYAAACVPPSERLLVLWFAPDIYYLADRLPAQRHLVYVPAWSALEHEQRLTLERVRSFSPPIAFADSSLTGRTRATYPALVEHVHEQYEVAGLLHDRDERYTILARRGRPLVRTYGEQEWPCYR